MHKFIVGGCLWLGIAGAPLADQHERAYTEPAVRVMEAFLRAFNARDLPAWADTLHFPHARIASRGMVVYPTREAFLAAMDLGALVASGWHHSTWDEMQIVQASATKVHIAVVFSRFDAAGERLASYESLYVLQNVDGRWGVRARSSYAP